MTALSRKRLLHSLAGPAVFIALVLLPVPGANYAIRGSIGLLVWMSWWWIAEPVHLAVTGFLPLAVLAVFNFLPVTNVLPNYSEQLVILLIGANLLGALWSRWGLDRRIALVSLLGIGTSTRRQILAWFLISAALSSVLPNAVVAAAMMPIVLALLRYIGIQEIGESPFGSALLIAIAWGTAIGGSGTPLGGAPNLLTIQFFERQLIQHEFLFTTWLTHLLPLTVLATVVSVLFIRYVFKPEIDRVEGTRAYFADQLNALGRLSTQERWGVLFFGAATVLAFTRQMYASIAPGLTPSFAFLAFAILSFAIRCNGEPLLTWEYAQGRVVWGLIYLFAGGSALGQILSDTGAAKFLAERLIPLASGGGFVAVALFSLMTMVLTQMTSNTATIAIIVPITISTFRGLGVNPIPFVYIVATVGNYGIMLPSSSAGPAIAAGYGVNLKTMFARGLWLCALLWIVLLITGYVLSKFWPGFAVA